MQDCFAYRNGKCLVLKIKECGGCGCKFYKTQEQFKLDRVKALERIFSLDAKDREKIFLTYYV